MDLFAENGPSPKRRLYEEKMVKRLGDFHFDTETASNAVITDVTDDRDDWYDFSGSKCSIGEVL